MNYIYTLSLMICSFAIVNNITNAKKNDSIFVPTKDWQTVNKGTPIPRGLHIRYNFQTGITEAKLMDEKQEMKSLMEKTNESQNNSIIIHPDNPILNKESDIVVEQQNNPVKINVDELKAVLKETKAKSKQFHNLLEFKNEKSDHPKRKKLKSYLEVMEELKTLNMNISTDTEVITTLFNKFQPYTEIITSINLDSIMIQDILEILNNMEYLIHQIDNAQIFSEMGGMTKMISPALNSTNSEIKAETLKLLGAAVQSNPKVQLKALRNNLVQKLLDMLTIENEIKIQSRCLYALGALLRNFPAGQKVFLNHNGLEIFGKILIDGNFQIQIRIMNLVNDLTIEYQNIETIQNEQELRIKEYDSMKLEYNNSMQKYCQHFVELMIRSVNNSEINDFYDTVYESMIILSFMCKNEYINKNEILLQKIQNVLVTYNSSKLHQNKNLILYYQKLLKVLQNIIVEKQHDEL